MKWFFSLSWTLMLLRTIAEGREYHYEKPQTPFITGAVEESYAPQQPATARYQHTQTAPSAVVRTQNGNAYEVSMAGSQQIYQGRLSAASSTHQAQPPHPNHPATHQNSGDQAQYAQQAAAYHGGQYAASYTAQSAAYGDSSQNLQYSANVNPFTSTHIAPHAGYVSGAHQGTTYSTTAQSGVSYYPGNSQGSAGAYSGQTSQSESTIYQGTPQPIITGNYPGTSQSHSQYSAGYPSTGQTGATYYAGNSQASTSHSAYFPGASQSGIASHAIGTTQPGLTYPTGTIYTGSVAAAQQHYPSAYNQGNTQSVGSNFGSNGRFAAADPLGGQIGDYVSQSEASQLDGYPYKQLVAGDARPYKRIITTCYPGGQCERQELAAGQVDGGHQHFVVAARARTAPVSDKCRRIAEAARAASDAYGAPPSTNAAGAAISSQSTAPPNRPHNRRLYEYREIAQRETFN